MRRKTLWGVAVVATLALAGPGCAKSTTTSTGNSGSPSATAASPTAAPLTTLEAGVLKVGSCLDYSPFEYYEGDTLKGFDVEITDALAQKLGLKVEWVKADFDTIFTSLAAGQFDAVAAASTIKPERLQVVDFTDPYYNARQSLTVNTDKTPDITSTDQLQSGQVVGVQKGTTGKDWATSNLEPKGVQIKTYTSITDAFTDLEAGQITGIVNDEPSSETEVKTRPGLAVVEPIDTNEHYGIAVAKDHPDITATLNAQLKAIIADGTYKTIFEKYFPGVPVPPEYGG